MGEGKRRGRAGKAIEKVQERLGDHAGQAIEKAQEQLGNRSEQTIEKVQERLGDRAELAIEHIQERIGDRAEHAIGAVIEKTPLEVPEIAVRPGFGSTVEIPELKEGQWYRVPVEGGRCADGSDYHIYVHRGTEKHLCVFLSGGGIAWNPYTAARPVTGGRVLAWQPNYYWNNLRPFTQVFNIGVGITDQNARLNPFRNWNFIVITYATGDLHLGRNDYLYKDEQGQEQTLFFHGYENFLQSMRIGKTLFPEADRLLIAGESAGAFAVPALAEQIHQEFYPACADVTLLSDSALLLNKEWKKTAREVWKIREETARDIRGRNLTLDWYRALYARNGERYRCLYACSVRDYLLSAFYNDVRNKKYSTDERMQRIFHRQLREMVKSLRKISPSFGIYLYDWRRPVLYRGGTIHTMVRQPEFFIHRRGTPSMAKWLAAAVEGDVRCVGLPLLEKRRK